MIDDEGEPVTGAQILLFSKGIVEGWPRTHMVVQSATDPEGSTRFLNLESGTYYASATGTPWYAQNAAASQGAGMREEDARQLDVAYPVTYYTATQDPVRQLPPSMCRQGNSRRYKSRCVPHPPCGSRWTVCQGVRIREMAVRL